MVITDGCVECGETDDDIELGWSVCRECFRVVNSVQERPSPWIKVAKVFAVACFAAAIFVLAAALGHLSAEADPDCGIDAPGVCGGYVGPGMATPVPLLAAAPGKLRPVNLGRREAQQPGNRGRPPKPVA